MISAIIMMPYFRTTISLLVIQSLFLSCWAQCPNGYSSMAGQCILVGQRTPWAQAQSACVKENATLIHTKVKEQWSQVAASIPPSQLTGVWYGLHFDKASNTWSWSDGTPFDPEKDWGAWGTGQPNTKQGECIVIKIDTKQDSKPFWYMGSCAQVMTGVCVKAQATTIGTGTPYTMPTFPNITCPEGLMAFAGNCMKYNHEATTYEDATAICTANNSYVLFTKDPKMWGYAEFGMGSQLTNFWIGLSYDENSKQFKYSNGEIYDAAKDWAPWAKDNPGEPGSWAGNCVGVQEDFESGHYMWIMTDCSSGLNGICLYNMPTTTGQKVTTPVTTTTSTTTTSTTSTTTSTTTTPTTTTVTTSTLAPTTTTTTPVPSTTVTTTTTAAATTPSTAVPSTPPAAQTTVPPRTTAGPPSSAAPTVAPTAPPTAAPTLHPTAGPTMAPTLATAAPTVPPPPPLSVISSVPPPPPSAVHSVPPPPPSAVHSVPPPPPSAVPSVPNPPPSAVPSVPPPPPSPSAAPPVPSPPPSSHAPTVAPPSVHPVPTIPNPAPTLPPSLASNASAAASSNAAVIAGAAHSSPPTAASPVQISSPTSPVKIDTSKAPLASPTINALSAITVLTPPSPSNFSGVTSSIHGAVSQATINGSSPGTASTASSNSASARPTNGTIAPSNSVYSAPSALNASTVTGSTLGNQGCHRVGHFLPAPENGRMAFLPFDRANTTDSTECGRQCLVRGMCGSIDFNTITKECRFLVYTFADDCTQFIRDVNFQHFDLISSDFM